LSIHQNREWAAKERILALQEQSKHEKEIAMEWRIFLCQIWNWQHTIVPEETSTNKMPWTQELANDNEKDSNSRRIIIKLFNIKWSGKHHLFRWLVYEMNEWTSDMALQGGLGSQRHLLAWQTGWWLLRWSIWGLVSWGSRRQKSKSLLLESPKDWMEGANSEETTSPGLGVPIEGASMYYPNVSDDYQILLNQALSHFWLPTPCGKHYMHLKVVMQGTVGRKGKDIVRLYRPLK
jgi:hypothetical protein